MNTYHMHTKICETLIGSGYGCINIVFLPTEIDIFNFLNSRGVDAFEVSKKDSKYLKGLLDDMGIDYTVGETDKKRFDYLILQDKDFQEIYDRIHEIPLLIGGPSYDIVQERQTC